MFEFLCRTLATCVLLICPGILLIIREMEEIPPAFARSRRHSGVTAVGSGGGGGITIVQDSRVAMPWWLKKVIGNDTRHGMTMSKRHPLGLEYGERAGTCGECAWARLRGPGPRVLRCGAAGNARVDPLWQSCKNWETELDCLSCAACCGPAYDVVEVSPRDPVLKRRPEWLVVRDGRHQMRRREDNHCQALQKDKRCSIYQDRPRCCQDFQLGGENCLFARRRLGFTRPWR